MARQRKSQQRKAVTVALIAAAVVLLAAIIVGVVLLVRMWNSDAASGSVSVPDLGGMTAAEAKAALEGAQLQPREGRKDYHDTSEKGTVFEQDPEAGQSVRPGRIVRYHISLGRATFTVPDLVGQSIDGAPSVLRKAGLRLGNVKRIYTRLRPSGRIVNQSPKLGEEFTQPVPVDVVVADSTAPPRVIVPDLYGLPLAGAEEILTRPELNLQLAVVQYAAEDSVAPGTVIDQQPGPGSEVELGSKIELLIGIPTLLKAQPTKQITLRIRIPDGADKQPVKIKVYDALGEKVDYSGVHDPGEIVERTLDVEGDAKVRIFIGDEKNAYREEVL